MIAGRLPWLRLDRTGIAAVGAVLLLASGTLDATAAWRSIDAATILLLFGMMIVSAQFQLGGGYGRLTRWLAARPASPPRLLLELMLVVALSSALLTNDVVCLAIAPVLTDVAVRLRLDPVPFLLGLAAAANIGSAATLIGNPQNILIGQALHLPFAGYLLAGAVPAVVGSVLAWAILARAYRGRWQRELAVATEPDPPFDGWQTTKGLATLLLLMVLFVLEPAPRETLALAAAALLLCSRRLQSRHLFAEIDWQLLLLFAALFVVNHAFAAKGHAARGFAWLAEHGVDVNDGATLFGTAVVGSNLVSNVPLTMLLLPATQHPQAGAILALATTLAGNLLLVGSIANLIVIGIAERLGVAPRQRSWFWEHARTGVPITLVTLLVAGAWLLLLA
ncbi:MAG: anion transporter [Planctomycetes bacterium]|nr:anion transporter [Planctomycetota bacterium]